LWLAWWVWDRSHYVFVTDARISATMVTVSSRVGGWVTDFPVDEGQFMNPGEKIAEIDSREARIRLEEIDASLQTLQARYQQQQSQLDLTQKQVNSRIEAQQSKLEAARSALSGSRVELAQAEKDWRRAQSLLSQDIISEEPVERQQADYDKARENLNRHQTQLSEAEAALVEARANLTRVDVLKADLVVTESRRREVEIDRERAKMNLDDHIVRSPIGGVVDETFINPGEFVQPGQRILLLHNPEEIWVKANVKETEIRHVKPGSPVTVLVDALPDREFRGEITSVGNAATSQFALLPAPNPSGNFTKITQRLEVKVALDQIDGLLKPGMMVELQIASK
ncbi:MAG: HlyD family secretion protein, partial [Pseudomonadales bacterium]|nr:HlyD family secretion protein [Pseudomonadales bacterium]